MAMLGGIATLNLIGIREENYIKAIKETIPRKYINENIKAFKMGLDTVKTMLRNISST